MESGYEMAGVFSRKKVSKNGKNSHFGYITVETESDSLYLKAGEESKAMNSIIGKYPGGNELKMQAQKLQESEDGPV